MHSYEEYIGWLDLPSAWEKENGLAITMYELMGPGGLLPTVLFLL